ncbi:MAG: hypothetical protein IJ901_01740 [Bacteroidaceae bacterium]|nr:hypothetical protein [Bacteroidaceae bacterium]
MTRLPAVVPATAESLGGTLWSYLCQEQRDGPSAQAVARWVAAFTAWARLPRARAWGHRNALEGR